MLNLAISSMKVDDIGPHLHILCVGVSKASELTELLLPQNVMHLHIIRHYGCRDGREVPLPCIFFQRVVSGLELLNY
jgi:hypothetical protein